MCVFTNIVSLYYITVLHFLNVQTTGTIITHPFPCIHIANANSNVCFLKVIVIDRIHCLCKAVAAYRNDSWAC